MWISYLCHHRHLGHVNWHVINVHAVIGAAHHGLLQFNAEPIIPTKYRCQYAPVIYTSTVCVGAVSGYWTCGILVPCLNCAQTSLLYKGPKWRNSKVSVFSPLLPNADLFGLAQHYNDWLIMTAVLQSQLWHDDVIITGDSQMAMLLWWYQQTLNNVNGADLGCHWLMITHW